MDVNQAQIKRLRCFLEKTREISKKHGLDFLRMLTDKKYLNENLSKDDCELLEFCVNRYLSKNDIKSPKIEWEEITPYTILGLSDGDYSKDELLNAVADKINEIELVDNDEIKREKTDEVLDAYNDIIKSAKGK